MDEHSKKIDDLSSLVRMDDPDEVLREAITTLGLFVPAASLSRLSKVFSHVADTYRGNVPGYRECNTGYHDLRHTTDIFLALSRLLHGMHLDGSSLRDDMVEPVMVAALLHDIGYIQRSDDTEGTGAKYTLAHIKRGIEFAHDYLGSAGFSQEEEETVSGLIRSTTLSVRLDRLEFKHPDGVNAAKALFISDILGQMADRIYLEKLLFLYREFMEANISGYASEEDLLKRTIDFCRSSWDKILNMADFDTRHMKAHFRERWGDDRDLYTRAVDNNIAFLRKILAEGEGGRHRDFLKREGMMDKLKKIEAGS